MSDSSINDIGQSKPRFLSLKWKSSITFLSVFVALLSLLVWHFYEQYHQDYATRLKELRFQQLEQLEKTVYRSGEQLHYIVNSIVLNTDSLDHSKNISLDIYRKRLEDMLPNLWSIWSLDEAVMLNTKASVLYHHQSPQEDSNFLLPWLQNNIEKQRTFSITNSTISIVCTSECRQVLLIPLMEQNARVAIIAISRRLLNLQQDFHQQSQSHLLIFQSANNSTDFATNPRTTNGNTDQSSDQAFADKAFADKAFADNRITSWRGSLIGSELDNTNQNVDSDIVETIRAASILYTPTTLLGASQAFRHQNKNYAISLLPIRGYDDLSLYYVLLKDTSIDHQILIRSLTQEIIVVSCLFAIFSIYIFALNWRYFSRVKQQLEILPLLGQNQFHDVRDIVNKNRQHNIFKDELDTLDDSVTTLSYQLESLEKAVNLRTREMERLSLFDTLTGLANRNLLQYELQSDVQRYSQQGGILAIVILDLDKFKRINDSIGHQMGDMLLGKIAARLKNATRSLGLVARLGGDEFAIILRSAKKYNQVENLCHKILELIHRPLELDDHSIAISCSLGVSFASKDHSCNDMIKNAEIAMYKAKETGGNAYRMFDNSMATEAHANLSLEADIRRAFDNREFTLYLQPKVNMESTIEGFESLIRWDHPDRGLVPPVEFIPAMENMGLISRLDNFVLDASCRQLKVLQTHYPNISIAVNISSTHFTDKNFLIFLKNCLDKYPINPSLLELEITETLLMENMSVGLEIIEQIKELGVRIAIDDFGTGYSSLSYLKKLPVDTIKIDREFIKDIPESESDMQISSVIIFLAKQLNFTVVAEGVETSEQLVFLKANQCDLAQGFFFSKPIPAHKAMLLLESQLGGKKLGYG